MKTYYKGMYACSYNAKIGDMVIPRCGTYKSRIGMVVDSESRREHHYLDRDLWFLILFGDKLHWQISYDCRVVSHTGELVGIE